MHDPGRYDLEPHGYYPTTKIQLDNGDGCVLLYRGGEEVGSSIEYVRTRPNGYRGTGKPAGSILTAMVTGSSAIPRFGVSVWRVTENPKHKVYVR